MNNGRDCVHGRQVGKCDTCDLIEAEKRINELEQENAALKSQVEQLRLAALSAISFMSGGDAKAKLRDAYDATSEQCLAEHDAEVAAKSVDVVINHYKTKFPSTEKFTAAWIIEGLEQYANQLRQQARGRD